MFFEEEVVRRLKLLFDKDMSVFDIYIRKNSGKENSLVIKTQHSPYGNYENKEFLIGRINSAPLTPYICFHRRHAGKFDALGIPYATLKKSEFIKIERADFMSFLLNEDLAEKNLKEIIIDALPFDAFDCCDQYNACSDNMACVLHDILFYAQCTYRKKLVQGICFYGKNRNV